MNGLAQQEKIYMWTTPYTINNDHNHNNFKESNNNNFKESYNNNDDNNDDDNINDDSETSEKV